MPDVRLERNARLFDDLPDADFVPRERERVKLRGNYLEVSNALQRDYLSSLPVEMRCLMIIARNTYGRGQESDIESYSYIGNRVGLRGFEPSTRGMSRNNVRVHLSWLQQWGFVVSSGEPGKMRSWALGPEALAAVKPRRRHARTVKESHREPRFRGEMGLAWNDATPVIKYDFFQWPNAFEDVLGPNLPTRLYGLLMKVWAETVGRINHDSDGIDRMREWYAAYPAVGDALGVSSRNTIADHIRFASQWGFLSVRRHGSNKQSSYAPGAHLWRIAKTGDLSPEYRLAFQADTPPAYPCLPMHEIAEARDTTSLAPGRRQRVGVRRG
jgi:hypothetical protein